MTKQIAVPNLTRNSWKASVHYNKIGLERCFHDYHMACDFLEDASNFRSKLKQSVMTVDEIISTLEEKYPQSVRTPKRRETINIEDVVPVFEKYTEFYHARVPIGTKTDIIRRFESESQCLDFIKDAKQINKELDNAEIEIQEAINKLKSLYPNENPPKESSKRRRTDKSPILREIVMESDATDAAKEKFNRIFSQLVEMKLILQNAIDHCESIKVAGMICTHKEFKPIWASLYEAMVEKMSSSERLKKAA